jgi:hypothetical protein
MIEGAANFDPTKVGLVTSLVVIIVVIVRTALTRKWVPGVYFEEMRRERNEARTEAQQSLAMLERMQSAHAEVLYQNSELVKKLPARFRRRQDRDA